MAGASWLVFPVMLACVGGARCLELVVRSEAEPLVRDASAAVQSSISATGCSRAFH